MAAVTFPAVTPITARLVVTGAHGQLGRALLALAPGARGYGRAELDITDADAVRAVVNPGDVVLNCAAYTAVDRAESEVEAAFAVNATGPAVLATVCAEVGAWLVTVSTDYVFPGNASHPYEPTDPTGPSTVYGRSKLAGEQAVLDLDPNARIVRTAWVYTGQGTDFVATMRRLEGERETVNVVADQLGSPTYAVDLAAGLLELAARLGAPTTPVIPARSWPGSTPAGQRWVAMDPGHKHAGMTEGSIPRILHATNAGQASWFELAQAVFEGVGADPSRVLPCGTADFPRPAPRPAYSVLSGKSWAAAGLTPLRDWRAALNDALSAISD
ncbi:dTDP-4-dehydrorhamnose reductase [Nocardia sp. NBC_01503]|uniref:dTDP-4-dehydrorhamnose reductase n=1 Tax=Nocardia sp. NBC_01503 TaxID=2975997 RepID=UPI002E7B0C14|nr:dTDP-4-dehydrorhamnose reductase [Nocardia sp. NBC_01503]WTL36338.1 dTDP-4-dehydrorhamnose reductase [Nocardia sp. NBC_01503]